MLGRLLRSFSILFLGLCLTPLRILLQTPTRNLVIVTNNEVDGVDHPSEAKGE